MCRAMGVEPTKLTAWMSGWARIASTASLSPLTTLNTPAGRPASSSSSARNSAADGSRSDGLSTKVLPQARATGNIHSETIAGKLNGVIPATTPRAWRRAWESMLLPMFSLTSPFSRCGPPQANSTTSMPRTTSPRASECTLPCSAVMIAASFPAFCSSSSLKRLSTRARRSGVVADQAGKAALAEATASLSSRMLASGTCALIWPVAGLRTSAKRPLRPSLRRPSM
ncbi:hypothetical protein D9M71_300760 [compost metagenome]